MLGDDMLPDRISVLKQDGRRFENLKSLVERDSIILDDADVPVDEGDQIERQLPGGRTELYEVLDSGFTRGGGGGIPDFYHDSWCKRLTANWFYTLYNLFADRPIRENVGDFRLLDREVVDALRNLSERSRFNKALYSWAGFACETVEFTRERHSAGTTKWKYWRLWNFALDGLTASTTAPLRIWTYVGAFTAIAAFAYAAFIVIRTVIYGVDSPGYASMLTVVLFMGGLNMRALGIMGEYVGRIAKEVRGRPLYVVQSTLGF